MPSYSLALFLALLATAPLAAGGWLMYRSMFLPTRGKRIASYPAPTRALVVLDLQEGWGGAVPAGPVEVPQGGLFGTVNALIGWAEGAGIEVVYLRQVFSNSLIVRLHGGKRQGPVIVDRRIRVINANDFAKRRTDAFSSRPFEQLLIERQVNELVLVGVDAAYCVYCTARGALQRGYRVTVVSDAVRSRKPLPAVLERFRRLGVTVLSSRELLR